MSGGGAHRADYAGGMFGKIDCTSVARNDSGSAARFYFTAKPSKSERELGCEHLPAKTAGEMTDRDEDEVALDSPRTGAGRGGGARNHHPCLKSIDLVKHFAAMILPPAHADGTPRRILIPFAGSGSECIGALRAGWDEIVGIERDAEFVPIAEARLTRWSEVPDHVDPRESKPEKADKRQASLFGKVAV